jgi:hypothetical protein
VSQKVNGDYNLGTKKVHDGVWVMVYFCAALAGRAFLSIGSRRLATVPNHNDNPKELGGSTNLH